MFLSLGSLKEGSEYPMHLQYREVFLVTVGCPVSVRPESGSDVCDLSLLGFGVDFLHFLFTFSGKNSDAWSITNERSLLGGYHFSFAHQCQLLMP